MSGAPPGKSRVFGVANGFNQPTPSESRSLDEHNPAPYSRDPTWSRGRVAAPPYVSASGNMGYYMGPVVSPRSQSSAASARSPMPHPTGELERRPSYSYSPVYSHHQAAKALASSQHSRNTSFVNSPATSPLSPQTIGSGVGASITQPEYLNLTMVRNPNLDIRTKEPLPTPQNGSKPVTTLSASEGVVADLTSSVPPQKRTDRSHGGRSRRGHGHQHSHSKQHRQEHRTFVGQADYKIDQCVNDIGGIEPRVEDVCGPGVDPEFDQLISALGHISRQQPRHLIDVIMYWRKEKGQAATDAKADYNLALSSNHLQHTSPRRYDDPAQIVHAGSGAVGSGIEESKLPSAVSLHEKSIVADRRSIMSIYLLCRVLIEVYAQTDLSCLTPQMAEKLEDIIFGQLRQTDPEKLRSSFRLANWKIYCQLLGVMSVMNLHSVSHRFITDLRTSQRDLMTRGQFNKELETKTIRMIQATQHLHVSTEHESVWKESCDLLYTLGDFFVNSHGLDIKHAYCQTLEGLLLPIAASGRVPYVYTTKWKEFLTMANSKVTQMLVKPRHWENAFRLSAVILCVSPTEVFVAQWLSVVTSLQAKLKDKVTRSSALQSISRLVWTYLERVSEPPSSVVRKLEDVIKVALPSGKRSYLLTDPTFAEPMNEIIRIIGYRYPDFCFKTVIFPLLNSELFASGKEIKVEQLEPERMVVAIRSFMTIVADRERNEYGRPPFPKFRNDILFSDNSQRPYDSSQIINMRGVAKRDEDRSGLPVATANLDETTKNYYRRFCEILGRITMLCDEAFGGQAVWDDKLGSLTPKTPISETFSFSRRDDHQAAISDQKQGFYELLHVAVQALPRCLSSPMPFNSLINLLCTGTAHVQTNIARSSASSLRAIAHQSHAQPVTMGFARFIFNFDARYSTMSDEGMLGPGHIENTLRLYVELLQIWIEEIKQKTKDAANETQVDATAGSRGLQLDLTSISVFVEDVESHGLFFLCSQSRRVRSFAVKVLKLVTEFDTALGKDHPRIIQILEGDTQRVIHPNDDQLSVAERTRLQKGNRRSNSQNTLIELSSSDVSYDSTLWTKLFPNLIRLSFEVCPVAVTLGRELVCGRLLQMHNTIQNFASGLRGPQAPVSDTGSARTLNRLGSTSPEVFIEQWKLYLVMACTTMTNAGAQTQSQLANAQHARKMSHKGSPQGQDKISSARSLFAFVIPLLSANLPSIRDAIVIALGSININLYRTLLESLQYAVTTCREEAKIRIGSHQRTGSNPQRSRRTDRLRSEVTHVYRLTARFLHESSVLKDESIIKNLSAYETELRIFLSDTEIQNDWECQSLRRQYCGLLEELYNGIIQTENQSRWLPFEARLSAFTLMEDWCGYSPNQSHINQREEIMRQSALAQHQDAGEKTNITASMEIERRNLRSAALSAMASLCAGPVRNNTTGGSSAFDVLRILSWIDTIFGTVSDKMHLIGRRALHNLIVHNLDITFILEQSVERCYASDRPRALESYFEVVAKVLINHPDIVLAFWRILGAVLFALGNEQGTLRVKAAKLLRTLEQRQQKSSKLQDFDISISDRTTAVYKLAQFEISKRLSKQHSELAFHIFSQFSSHFRVVSPEGQRNMIAAILPWVQTIELQLDPNGGPTAQSYMLLANLLEITIKSSSALHNEVQALWQALATGPHGGNVQLVLDFVISLCLDRKDQSFVDYVKQIIVWLSSTPAGQKVVEFLLLQITPKNMVQEKREQIDRVPDGLGMPYIARLSETVPVGSKQTGFSLGQLSLIFLVDLMVAPIDIGKESVPLLLQVVLVLWDHYNSLVQEQSREMLVHLIHELVITQIDDNKTIPNMESIETFVESIRQHDASVVWTYEECNGKDGDDGKRVPTSMTNVTGKVIGLFALAYPKIHEQWSRTTLSWATSCPVRHIACRSFQIFRCTLSSLDQPMLADMLARLSNTIADEEAEIQTFSMEILTTLKTIISALEPADILKYRQLFWATCACLHTIHEREFMEALEMLSRLLGKVDLGDPAVLRMLREAKPERWQDPFEGIAPLVHKGFKSATSLHRSLLVFDQIVQLPDSELTGSPTRILYGALANLPCFLLSFDEGFKNMAYIHSAQILASVAEQQEYQEISIVLNAFVNRRYSSSQEFKIQLLSTLRRSFFPKSEARCLIFLIGLLTNRLHWYKLKVLEILCTLIPEIDTQRPEIASHGPDLISPLLRLLQTEYCARALDIMDHIVTMSATPMDNDHLRMSMASSGSRTIRKEYEKTKSLYGIPEDTGWSIPMPAIHSNTTRENLQAVLYTCANPNAPTVATPEIEFDAEEYQQSSYFSIQRSDTMDSEETRTDFGGDGNMGELVLKLDSLNDFFDETLTGDDFDGRPYSGATITAYHTDSDSGADLYDQQTAPILNKTLARTASVTSLHNSFSDTRTDTQDTDAKIAANLSFSGPLMNNILAPNRPALHFRSITSPSNELAKTSNIDYLSEEDSEGTHSEDERATGYLGPRAPVASRGAQPGFRKVVTSASRKENRYRGGLLRAHSRSKVQSPDSPEVPIIPEVFLKKAAKTTEY
ncbi:MAG: hypothetical protein Q9167_001777 [Letrouitia subvulpina]